ncbi:MAG: M23 family metallopeptidase [Azoarcus sp.]|jgi:murein DD-endopeptidase MepM/ murein hydrolase activator NlpD|nr:M23 family metallopeptidase [Azoarcus sp.]
MKNLFRFTLLLLCWPLAAALASGGEDYPFRIDEAQSPQGIRFIAVNNGPAPMTVFFKLDGNNIQADRKLPLAIAIAPRTSREIARVSPRKRSGRFSFQYEHSAMMGDAFTPPDEAYRYRLPFGKGVRTQIVQAPGGTLTTHDSDHLRNAVDFGLPEGTLVTAARAGTVVEVKDGFTVGRLDPALAGRANRVIVVHSDNTLGHYLHLAPKRVLVRPGQRVDVGEALAYSGNTGYSGGPHLHFDVRRAAVEPGGMVTQKSVPLNFHDAAGRKITIREGVWVEADQGAVPL